MVNFENKKKLNMEVQQGFEKYFPIDAFEDSSWIKARSLCILEKLLKAILRMAYKQSKADPCLYFKWAAVGLV